MPLRLTAPRTRIAAQSILLGAREQGLAGCMIGSINKELLQEKFHLPKRFEVLLRKVLYTGGTGVSPVR